MSARRSKERGSIVVIAMIVLVALISIGGMSVLSVRSGIASSGYDRFKATAVYAAESGAAVAMDFLRRQIDPAQLWSAYVEPNNAPPGTPVAIPGNGIEPGQAGNLFSPELGAWYEIVILNNTEDPGLVGGDDTDGRVTVRVTGHGPNNTAAQIEWEIQVDGPIGSCAGYAGQLGGQYCGGVVTGGTAHSTTPSTL